MKGNSVLMIVDVQTGMFDESYPVANGDELLATLNQLIDQAREAGIPIIYIQHDGAQGGLLDPDKPGWPIHPAVAPIKDDVVIRKRHSDSFQGTGLQNILEKLQIEKIVMVGIQTEYCVDTTCRRAYSLGYDVALVQDGHTTWDTKQLEAAQIIAHHNEVLGNSFASLVMADDVQF